MLELIDRHAAYKALKLDDLIAYVIKRKERGDTGSETD